MKKLLTVIFVLLSAVVLAQVNADSLLNLYKDQIHTDVVAALETSEKALKIAKKENDSLNIALSKKCIGTAYYLKENHQKAINYLMDAQTTLEQLNNTKELAYCNNNLALVYKEVGLYKRAAQLYFSNIKYFNAVKDTFRLCQSYNNLGVIYEKMTDFEDALKYYNYALQLNDDDLNTQASLFLNIAIIHDLRNQTDSAIIYYQKALDLYEDLKYKMYESYVYGNLSALHLKKGDFKNALKYQQLSYKIEEGENNIQLLTYYNLANIYFKQQRLSEAGIYAHKAYELGESTGNLTDYYHVVTLLKNIYKEKGNPQEALKYAEEQLNIKIELSDELKLKELKKLNIEYETEKKKSEIIQLESDKKIVQHEANLQRLYKNVAFSGILIAIVIIVLIINRMRISRRLVKQQEELILIKEEAYRNQEKINTIQTEKLKTEIEHKNRELSSSALASSQKNELLAEVDLKIKELESNPDLKSYSELKGLKRLIKENRNIDNDWENFKVHFDNVHPNFYKKLSTEYSSLSPNDLKHCAYIKVNLSSKEIARIMNISPKSVQMTRYRLKKKFNLTPEQDLFEFIEQI